MLTPTRRYVVRRRRGLGQDPSIDILPDITDPGALGPTLPTFTNFPSTGSPTAQSGGALVPTWLQTLLGGAAATTEKIALSQTNPLTHLAPGTYYASTPGGTVVSTAGIPGTNPLSALTTSSMMPMLLIGGVVLMFMMASKR